jgi:Skp family chaperone for outer membrane proteins
MYSRSVLLLLLGVLAAAFPVRAQSTCMAILDPGRVLEQLDEYKVGQERLASLRKVMQEEGKKKQEEIEQIKMQRGGNPGYHDVGSREDFRLLEAVRQFEAWVKFKEEELEIIDKNVLADLRDKIAAAAKELARHERIDAVLNVQVPQIDRAKLSPDQLRDALLARPVLYANPALDITQKLVEKMNAEYRKSQGPTPPAR